MLSCDLLYTTKPLRGYPLALMSALTCTFSMVVEPFTSTATAAKGCVLVTLPLTVKLRITAPSPVLLKSANLLLAASPSILITCPWPSKVPVKAAGKALSTLMSASRVMLPLAYASGLEQNVAQSSADLIARSSAHAVPNNAIRTIERKYFFIVDACCLVCEVQLMIILGLMSQRACCFLQI